MHQSLKYRLKALTLASLHRSVAGFSWVEQTFHQPTMTTASQTSGNWIDEHHNGVRYGLEGTVLVDETSPFQRILTGKS